MPSSTLRPGLAPSPAPGPSGPLTSAELASAELASAELASAELASAELVSAELAGLRLVQVPDAAPPYDGQVHGDCGRVQVASAEPAKGPGPGQDSGPAQVPAGTGDLGSLPGGQVTALALVIVEALAGVRPERQLLPLTTDRVRARIRGLSPLLRCDQRPRVLRILASQPAPRVVEMTVVATFGPRSRALALRFEHAAARPATPGRPARPASWRCTAIEAG